MDRRVPVLRTFICQSGLVVVLAAMALPALLMARPPGDGPLCRMSLPLSLTVVEVVWIIFLLPFNVHPRQAFRRASTFRQAAIAGILLAIPLVFITGRLAGAGMEFILGSQVLILAAAAAAVPLARLRGHVWYLSGALAVLFLPLLVREFAADLASASLVGVPSAISPVAALADAFPDRAPTSAIAVMLGCAAFIWGLRLALPRGMLGFILAGTLLALGAGVSEGPRPELVRLRSPLGGHYRPGMVASVTLDLRNASDRPADGEIRVVTEGGATRAPLRIGAMAEGEAHLRIYLPGERPAFRVTYEGGGEPVPLLDIEEGMNAFFRPLGTSEILIGWIGEFPESLQEILGRIAATQVRLPEVIGPGWEGLEALDLIVVARPLGEQTARVVRQWQAHGGKVLSLSRDASIALGAPAPAGEGDIALRRRGEGLLATLDLQGDRGALFEKARSALGIDGRNEPTPGSVLYPGLFRSAALGLAGRRNLAGWILAYAALAAAAGWILTHHRLVAQAVLAALILAASSWVLPPPVVTECFTLLSGSRESSAFARTCVLRVANLGESTEVGLDPVADTVVLPMGSPRGLTRRIDGGWRAAHGRGDERVWRLLSTETLSGVLDARVLSQGELRVVNGSGEILRDAIYVEGSRAWSIGDLPHDLKSVYSVRPEESAPLAEVVDSGDALWQRALLEIAKAPGPWLFTRIDRPREGPEMPGTAAADPHPTLLVLRLSRAGP